MTGIKTITFDMAVPTGAASDVVPCVVVAPSEAIEAYLAGDKSALGPPDGIEPPETAAGILFIPDEMLNHDAGENFADDLVQALITLAAKAIEPEHDHRMGVLCWCGHRTPNRAVLA